MEESDRTATAEVVAAYVREALQRGEPASVEGLGTWRVEHQPSRLREDADDRVSVMPPRDTVAFEPTS